MLRNLPIGLAACLLTVGILEAIYAHLLPIPAMSQLGRNYSWTPSTQAELATIRPKPGFEQPIHFGELKPVREGPYPWSSSQGITLDQSKRTSAEMFHVPASFKGHGFKPGVWHSSGRTSTGEVLYDIESRIDPLGRRETPNPNPEKRTRYLMNLGCSFTYGEGRTQDETISAYLAKLAPGYHVYNYGRSGDGPFEVLSLLDDINRDEHIAERDGIATYLYINDDVRRMIPSILYYVTNSYFDRGGWSMPYYEEASGELRRYNGYLGVHPLLGFFYGLLAHSNILAYYEVDVPWWLNFDDLRKAARVMRGMRDAYERKFGNDRFYVVLYPEGEETPLPLLLKEAGVKFLNYERFNMGRYTRGKPAIHDLDAHPSAEANALLARELVTDLKLSGGTPP